MGRSRQRKPLTDSRPGTTLLESIIVLSIIAIMLALLLPAVQRARVAAMDATCMNNLHQLSLATHEYWKVRKSLPDPAQPNTVGGWAIAILPFLDDRLLANQLAGNPSLSQHSILPLIGRRPRIMTCPLGWEGDSSIPSVPTSHYAFERLSPYTFRLFDVPLKTHVAWVQSPEMGLSSLPEDEGPHASGYNVAW
jgi:type II secretory pathway pseudopilin PulG